MLIYKRQLRMLFFDPTKFHYQYSSQSETHHGRARLSLIFK